MGKVSRRLTIVVFPPLDDWPEIEKLEEQGHTIVKMVDRLGSADECNDIHVATCHADLIIGPQCWYFDVKHRKYLTQAIKQARLRRYGAPQRKAGKMDAEDDNIPFGPGPDTGKP